MSDYVTVYNRDVCADGFGLENVADAVFLDLPSPWNALASAKKALKKEGGRICTFSPCIEQVQKSVIELTELGFTDIFTVESLRRVLCVKKYEMANFDFNMDMKIESANPNSIKNGDKETHLEDDASKRKLDTCNNELLIKKKKSKLDSNNEESDSSGDDEECTANSKTVQYAVKPINLQPGHTSFLTFATLLHKDFQKIK
jgi:hypothetical protein